MTTFLLIRHASTDSIGKAIVGRNPGVHLNPQGMREAETLAEWVAKMHVAAIYSSPLERARETAAPLARRLELPVNECEDLNEMNFGVWSGLSFEELHAMPEWHRFNSLRSVTAAPGGESMLDVQARIVALMKRLAQTHPQQQVALFSHSDVIKAALVHFLGSPLDLFQRLEVSPASVSTLALADAAVKIIGINHSRISCRPA